jgi:hypothetical protein
MMVIYIRIRMYVHIYIIYTSQIFYSIIRMKKNGDNIQINKSNTFKKKSY